MRRANNLGMRGCGGYEKGDGSLCEGDSGLNFSKAIRAIVKAHQPWSTCTSYVVIFN